MRVLFKYLCFLVILNSFLSCKKDKEEAIVIVKETPMKKIIQDQMIIDTNIVMENGSYEFGFKFYSSINGTITKLGCQMPEIGSYRVSIWEYDSKNLIVATTIKSTDTTKYTYNDISPLEIIANKRYAVSINNISSNL
jgi:hypothetical protein